MVSSIEVFEAPKKTIGDRFLVIDSGEGAVHPAWRGLFILICVGSFLLYALAALALHQERANGWTIEGSGPIPSALSHLLYGLPLGAVDYNLLMNFYHPKTGAIRDVIAAAVAGSIPRGPTLMYTLDGNGAGENLFATLAMRMFGPRILSLILFYLTFVGISAIAFVCRYRDQRLIVVPLYFLAVTVMLATPLSDSPAGIGQNAIGGIRYYVLAAFLPALHIFFEFFEPSNSKPSDFRFFNYVLLFIQGMLFFAALLVRSSTGYLVGAFILALAWRLYRDRAERRRLIPLGVKSLVLGAALAFWAVFVVAAMPAYVQSGRVFGIFWHRAFISFATHPEWPFGNLESVFNCAPHGELTRSDLDQNGGCVWVAYAKTMKLSENDIERGVYSDEYEKVLRNAYFYVLTHYPRQAIELYVEIKPQEIKGTIIDAWTFLLQLPDAPVPERVFVLIAGQCVLFAIFIILSAFSGWVPINQLMVVFPLLFLLSLAPRFVAWASWMTGADLILLMYICLIIGVALTAQLLFLLLHKITLGGEFRECKTGKATPPSAARSITRR